MPLKKKYSLSYEAIKGYIRILTCGDNFNSGIKKITLP